jgi:tetratricopeptide (TPR) repeat protein
MSFLFLVVIAGFGVYMLYVSRGDKGEDGSFLSEALPFYRLAGFGILWFFLALMVESSVIPIVDVIYEHRVYLPSVGAFLALSTGAYVISERSRRRWPKADRAFLSSCAVIVIALSTATYARNTIWQDGIRLWEDVIKKSPFKSRGYNDLGYLHLTKGSLDRAIEYFQISIQLRPSNADAHNNLGVAFYSHGTGSGFEA